MASVTITVERQLPCDEHGSWRPHRVLVDTGSRTYPSRAECIPPVATVVSVIDPATVRQMDAAAAHAWINDLIERTNL